MRETGGQGGTEGFARRQREAVGHLRLADARVPREHLLRRLDALQPLIQVCGPPGSGKTTLLADWTLERLDAGDVVIWISASEALDSLDACARRICEIVRGTASDARASGGAGASGGTGLPGAAEGDSADPAGVLARLCAAHPRVILVIDDSHLFRDPRLRRWLLDACAAHPGLHLAGASHELRPLSPDVAATGLPLTALTGRQLMAAVEELPEFAASWGHRLALAEAVRLHAESGGWLALARALLDDPEAFAGVGSAEAVQRFRRSHLRAAGGEPLLFAASAVAVLGTVSAALLDHLCRALSRWLPAGDGEAFRSAADGLLDSGLLRIEEDGEGGDPADATGRAGADERRRLPETLREPLAREFASAHPGTDLRLHAEAARYYREAGREADLGRLMIHARHAEDWDLLARIAARQGWFAGVRWAHEAHEAFGTVPEQILRARPVLSITSALIRAQAAAASEPERRSAPVQRVLSGAGAAQIRRILGTGDPDERAFLGTALVNGLRQAGEVEGALRLSEELRTSTLHRRDAVTPLNRAMYYLQAGFAELYGGELGSAVRRFGRAYEEHTSAQAGFVASSAAAHSAVVFAYEGRRDNARQWLRRAEEGIAEQPWTASLLAPALSLAQADLALDEFDVEGARRHLQQVGEPTGVSELWPLAVHTRARLALLFGHPASALDTIEYALSLREDAHGTSTFATAMVTRARCDLLVAEGELNRAHALIAEVLGPDPFVLQEPVCSLAVRALSVAHARICRIAGKHGTARQVVSAALARSLTRRQTSELLLIDAAAALLLGQEADAARSAGRGLVLAERAGMRTALLGVEREVRLALLELLADDPRADLPAWEPALLDHPGVFPARAELVELTERELSVLRELAAGLSVAEIARTHVLSVNTVKKQTVSLYRKLGADGRGEALRRAYELRLLD